MNRLLFLVTSLDVGGIERYLLRLVRHLASSGWGGRIDVLCKSGQAGTLADQYQEAGARVVPLRQGYWSPRSWRKLASFLREGNFLAECDMTGDFGGITHWLAARAGIQHRVCFYRGSTHHFRADPLRLAYWRAMHGLTMRYATSILSNSAAALDFFCRGWRNDTRTRFAVAPNWIPLEEFDRPVDRDEVRAELGIPAAARVVGHIGRYDPSKNHLALLDVAATIAARYPDVVFLLCGRGVDTGLGAAVRARGLSGSVVLQGNRDDVPRVLRSMDAFLFPSVTEGQPNALLEALIAGLPFVASDIAVHREALPQEAHVRLYPPSDVLGMAQGVQRVLDRLSEERQEMDFMAQWARARFGSDQCLRAVLPHLGIHDARELPAGPADVVR